MSHVLMLSHEVAAQVRGTRNACQPLPDFDSSVSQGFVRMFAVRCSKSACVQQRCVCVSCQPGAFDWHLRGMRMRPVSLAAGPHSAFSHHMTPFSAGRVSASLQRAAPSSTAAPVDRDRCQSPGHEELTPAAAEATDPATSAGRGKKRPRLPDSQADSAPRSGSAQRVGGHRTDCEQSTPEPQQEHKLVRAVSFKPDGAQIADRDGSLPPHLASRRGEAPQADGRVDLPAGVLSEEGSEELPPGFGSPSAAARAKGADAAADDPAAQVQQRALVPTLADAACS